jgi:hypothetical protein
MPAAINIGGTSLRANWEASSTSPSDLPILELERVDNGQIIVVQPASRDAATFASAIQGNLADGHYRATIISAGVPSESVLIAIRTVPLIGPTSMTATADSTMSVAVSWLAVNGAANYEILRTADHINYISRGIVSGTMFEDSAASATAYLYKVHAIDALGAVGPDSTPDLATTVMFSDDPITPGSTIIRAAHITELRSAVGAVRTLAGLTPYTFSDSSIVIGTTFIQAVHITDLRAALDPARSALGLPPIGYTDSVLTQGVTTPRAAHIMDLRAGTK